MKGWLALLGVICLTPVLKGRNDAKFGGPRPSRLALTEGLGRPRVSHTKPAAVFCRIEVRITGGRAVG